MMCSLTNLDKRWLCLQVKSGGEFRSAWGLRERGYETFVPAVEQKRRWSDRVKIVQIPLFTGYVFLRFNASNIHPAVTVPGVLRFVGTEKMPTPIEDSQIEALQVTTRSGLMYGPCAFLEAGQEVEVRLGPLASLRGKIVRFKSGQRLIISLNLIKQSVFVEVDGYEVVPLVIPISSASPAERYALGA